MAEQQTPEDDIAEIKLRIALKLYDSDRPIRLRAADFIRLGAEAQTLQSADKCIHDISVTIAVIYTEEASGKMSYRLRDNKRDWIAASAKKAHSGGATWADRTRRLLNEADHSHVTPGELMQLWNEAYMHW